MIVSDHGIVKGRQVAAIKLRRVVHEGVEVDQLFLVRMVDRHRTDRPLVVALKHDTPRQVTVLIVLH